MEAKAERRVQVQVRKNNVVFGSHGEGAILWLSEDMAKKLADARAVDIIGASFPLAPAPQETKPAGPSELKSSSAEPTGQSTDSPESAPPHGEKQPQSSSAEVRVSPRSRSKKSGKQGKLRRRPSGS